MVKFARLKALRNLFKEPTEDQINDLLMTILKTMLPIKKTMNVDGKILNMTIYETDEPPDSLCIFLTEINPLRDILKAIFPILPLKKRMNVDEKIYDLSIYETDEPPDSLSIIVTQIKESVEEKSEKEVEKS